MAKIKVHEFISLDGVIENPAWTAEFGFTPEMGAAVGGITADAKAILLGRNTYHMFEQGWSERTVEDDEGAPFFNDTTKYVVSSTLTEPTWRNSELIGGYDPAVIAKLKADAEGDIFTGGSAQLVRALLTDGLVDELHLFLFPVALGSGQQLFPEGGPKTSLDLIATRPFSNGVVQLTYGPRAA